MPDLINPRLGNDELVEHLLQQYPALTVDEVIEISAAFGFDLKVSPELPRKWRRKGTGGKM